jgi:hypothetical protein
MQNEENWKEKQTRPNLPLRQSHETRMENVYAQAVPKY